jgi:hypothetical protein
MLDRITTFNSLVDLIVLLEGYFHVPQKVYRHIIRDYYDILRVVKSQNIKRMRRESFPVKVYELDFSGTNFEFLNHLDPNDELFNISPDWTPSIKVRYTSSGGSWYTSDYRTFGEDRGGNREKNRGNMGYIQIDLSNGNVRQVVDIIEHEILHYVQNLIKRRKKLSDVGGLPPKEIMDDRYDTSGYRKGSEEMRRAKHSHRPIEYYPDLLSSIRQMEYTFSRYHPEYQYDSKKPTKWEKEKKQFFLGVLNGFPVNIATKTFNEFKKISKEFYNHMVKVGYDAFVNKPPNLDMSEIRRIGSELGLDVSDLPKANLEVINNPPKPKDDSQEYSFQEIKTNDRKMFEDSLGKDIEGLHYFNYFRSQSDDPNEFSFANIRYILNGIGIWYKDRNHTIEIEEPNSFTKTGRIKKLVVSVRLSFSLPTQKDGVELLFKDLKEKKDSNANIFETKSWRPDQQKVGRLKEEDRQKAYQSLYNYFVNMYLKKGKPNEYTKKTFLEFLENLNF